MRLNTRLNQPANGAKNLQTKFIELQFRLIDLHDIERKKFRRGTFDLFVPVLDRFDGLSLILSQRCSIFRQDARQHGRRPGVRLNVADGYRLMAESLNWDFRQNRRILKMRLQDR